MATKLQSQQLFDALNKALEKAFDQCLRNQEAIDLQFPQLKKTPLGAFLNEVKEFASGLNYDKNFLKNIYYNAFMIGPIPTNANHIAFTGKISSFKDDVTNETEINLWVDLDKLSRDVNAHLQMDNIPHRVRNRAKRHASSLSSSSLEKGRTSTGCSVKAAVNSQQNPSKHYSNHFILSLLTGIVSGYSLIIAALAVANVVSLGTVAISALVVTGIVAGAASYYFFQRRNGGFTNPEATLSSESENTLDELFEQTFQSHHQNNPALDHDNSKRTIADELKATDIFSEAVPLLGLN